MIDPVLSKYISNWGLSNLHLISSTQESSSYKVVRGDQTCVLKIFKDELAAQNSTKMLIELKGKGLVELLEQEGPAELLAFLPGPSLTTLVNQGHDNQATQIFCQIAHALSSRSTTYPGDPTLSRHWLETLLKPPQITHVESTLAKGAKVFRRILDSCPKSQLLHGDLHHDNVLKDAAGSWVAIDPKGVWADPSFEVSNIFYNPEGYLEDLEDLTGVIKRRCHTLSNGLNLDSQRILAAAFVYGCLKICWHLEDRTPHEKTLRLANSIYDVLMS